MMEEDEYTDEYTDKDEVQTGVFFLLPENQRHTVRSKHLPDKAGGKPAWFSLKHLPNPDELKCKACNVPCKFLLQVFSEDLDPPDNNFNQAIFIFYCTNKLCTIKNTDKKCIAFRSQLPWINEFYKDSKPEDRYIEAKSQSPSAEEYNKLCNVCGCLASIHCASCKKVDYCGKEHQEFDWEQGHKIACKKPYTYENTFTLPEGLLVIADDDDSLDDERDCSPVRILSRYIKLLMARYPARADPIRANFWNTLHLDLDQVVRRRGLEPLWASEHVPSAIPPCSYCGAPRKYLLQVLPQLLAYMESDDLNEYATLAVYICSENCNGDNPLGYHREYVWKQDFDDKSPLEA